MITDTGLFLVTTPIGPCIVGQDNNFHFPWKALASVNRLERGCEVLVSPNGLAMLVGNWLWHPSTDTYTYVPDAAYDWKFSSYDGTILAGGRTVWTLESGARDISCLLRQLGSPATGWQSLSINGISYDGKMVVGEGTSPSGKTEGWYAYIDSIPHGPDFDDNGGVNGEDIGAFFSVWEAGDTKADLNGDGGIDATDIDTFFMMWESGAC